jgi:hypothetical protein
VGCRSNSQGGRGRSSPAAARFPATAGLGVVESRDAGLPGGDGGDDEVRRVEVSMMVVVASAIASRSGARARPKLPGAGGAQGPDSSAWGRIRVRGFGGKEREGGYL